jgi:hypothetical protein
MSAATHHQTLAARLALFLILPVAIWWGLDYVIPGSILIARDLFFPFVSHAGLVAQGLWMYVANGIFVVVLAVLTVVAGRRFSIWANIGFFVVIAIAGSLMTHATLSLFGFPFHGDAP